MTTHRLCQHCPEVLWFVDGAWRSAPLSKRPGATHCRGTIDLEHKPMPEIKVRRA